MYRQLRVFAFGGCFKHDAKLPKQYQFLNTGLAAGLGITDNEWRRLAVVGYARPYTIVGESSKKEFSISVPE